MSHCTKAVILASNVYDIKELMICVIVLRGNLSPYNCSPLQYHHVYIYNMYDLISISTVAH